MENDGYDDELLEQMERTTKYWVDQAQMTLKDRLYKKPNTNVAKNIVFFLGDGLSLTTITAARIFQGQLQGKRGEESDLWFQKFPNVGLAKVSYLLFKYLKFIDVFVSSKNKIYSSFVTTKINFQIILK